jgi:dihydrofolate reductase
MTITLIAAVDQSLAIGYKNKLLCNLKDDLKHFKKLTKGKFILMGSNTFYSIGNALPERQNLVLTRKVKHRLPDDVFVYHDIETILFEYENYAEKSIELMVIGGQSIYEQMLPYADKIVLTIIQHTFNKADAFFPKFDESEWDKKCIGHHKADEDNEYDFYITEYTRKKTKLK